MNGILFLPKCTIADLDYVEVKQDILVEDTVYVPESYGHIPKYYHSYRNWITTTKIDCWYCSCSIPGPPWFLPKLRTVRAIPNKVVQNLNPKNIHELGLYTNTNAGGKVQDLDLIIVEGLFCSPFCVMSYMRERYMGDPHLHEMCKMLRDIYADFTGTPIDFIPEADNKYILKKFCGDSGKTESEYFKSNQLKIGFANIFQ